MYLSSGGDGGRFGFIAVAPSAEVGTASGLLSVVSGFLGLIDGEGVIAPGAEVRTVR